MIILSILILDSIEILVVAYVVLRICSFGACHLGFCTRVGCICFFCLIMDPIGILAVALVALRISDLVSFVCGFYQSCLYMIIVSLLILDSSGILVVA